MSAYANATRWLLAPSAERAIKSVSLSFLIAEPYLLHAVACAVDDLLLDGSNSSLESLEMDMWTDRVAAGAATLDERLLDNASITLAPYGPFGASDLTLQNPAEEDAIAGLFGSCNMMQLLSLGQCDFGTTSNATLRIDGGAHVDPTIFFLLICM